MEVVIEAIVVVGAEAEAEAGVGIANDHEILVGQKAEGVAEVDMLVLPVAEGEDGENLNNGVKMFAACTVVFTCSARYHDVSSLYR